MTIKELCKQIKEYDVVFVAYEQEENNKLKEELKQLKNDDIKIAVIIGPEGGIEEKEIGLLKSNGAKIITLGKRILRTETVGIVLASIIMYELEQM